MTIFDITLQNSKNNLLEKVDSCLESLKVEKTLLLNSTSLDNSSKSKNKPLETLQDKLRKFEYALLDYLEITSPSEPIKANIFNKNISNEQRRFISICLLRLLSYNPEIFEQNYGTDASILFDETLKDIYNIRHIDAKMQRYEKKKALENYVNLTEENLDTILSSISSIDTFLKFRQDFMRSWNQNEIKAIIHPFVSKEITKKLNDIFTPLEIYAKTNKTEQQIIEVYYQAIEKLKAFIEEVSKTSTKYAIKYLVSLADNLKGILEADFEKSPYSKPAEITVQNSEKKYPLIEPRTFNLSFNISNSGLGSAFGVKLFIDEVTDINVLRNEIYIGQIRPSSTILNVLVPVKNANSISTSLCSGKIEWTNFDNTVSSTEFIFEIYSQRSDIDWDSLALEEPYSLEPVTTEAELVGRHLDLNKLLSKTQAVNVGSFYIWGQKRVGKTSVVKTLETRLKNTVAQECIVVYLEAGAYIRPTALKTLEHLGIKLCQEIKDADSKFANLQIPNFSDALAPLDDFLRLVLNISPSQRIIFILDEFDELPMELYKRGELGDAFFLTIRTISGKASIGFILVGGEKMAFVESCQGDALNKFSAIKIDYFDKQNHWNDFKDLVLRPLEKWTIEISDTALDALYNQTAGNPYFTKLLCAELFKIVVERRDSHVTINEVEDAIKMTLENVRSNSFQHFWEDSILLTGDKAEEESINRRKLLLAFAELLTKNSLPTKDQIIETAKTYDLQERNSERLLREFIERNIFISQNETISCNVPFFEKWLKEKGINRISLTFTDRDAILERKKLENEMYIRSDEIVSLVNSWGSFQGRKITEDLVRNWLNQFGENSNQRLILQLLKHLKFYSHEIIIAKLEQSHVEVRRDSKLLLKENQKKRDDIIVSYLGAEGKSGLEYARLYAKVNDIYIGNVKNFEKIVKEEISDQKIQKIVFVDDFVGTGSSVCESLEKLCKSNPTIKTKNYLFFLIAICGFKEGQIKIEEKIKELEISMKVIICDLLDEDDKCFSADSFIFDDATQRENAKKLAYGYGEKLVKDNPLGYGGCEAVVVFENTCPNNTLPILWKEAKDWTPLFKRN